MNTYADLQHTRIYDMKSLIEAVQKTNANACKLSSEPKILNYGPNGTDTYSMECKFDSTKNRNKYYGVLPPPCNRESLFFSMPILKDKTIIGNAVCDSSNRWIKRDGVLFDTVIDNQEIIKNKYVFDVENAIEPGMMGSGLGYVTDYRLPLGAIGAIGTAAMLAPGLATGALGYLASGAPAAAGTAAAGNTAAGTAAGAAAGAAGAGYLQRLQNKVHDYATRVPGMYADSVVNRGINDHVARVMQTQPVQRQQQPLPIQRPFTQEQIQQMQRQQQQMQQQQLMSNIQHMQNQIPY